MPTQDEYERGLVPSTQPGRTLYRAHQITAAVVMREKMAGHKFHVQLQALCPVSPEGRGHEAVVPRPLFAGGTLKIGWQGDAVTVIDDEGRKMMAGPTLQDAVIGWLTWLAGEQAGTNP